MAPHAARLRLLALQSTDSDVALAGALSLSTGTDSHRFDECFPRSIATRPPAAGAAGGAALGRKGTAAGEFSSLSKRSQRDRHGSGFVAGDAGILKKFLLYRTYQGCAMSPPIHMASIAAWQDETHVVENRRLYREKFSAALKILQPVLDVEMPAGGFYLWPKTSVEDTEFARRLYQEQAVSVLPGTYLARSAHGTNPGVNRVRIALVASTAEGTDAARAPRAGESCDRCRSDNHGH